VRRFPQPARREAGRQLNFIQDGGEASDWKAMPTVGHGVLEIRIHASGQHRVLLVASLGPEIYVLHAFEKKSRKTARRDIELARRRYRDLRRELEVR
jgi:phage-related protein